jgi:outer membrane immunogenic protein
MKTLLGLVAVGALIAGPAMAADLGMPLKEPQASWGGCYIGGNIANGWSQSSITDSAGSFAKPPGLSFGTSPASGIAGGGQIGCDKAIGPWLLGVKGMFDAAGIQSTSLNPAFGVVPSAFVQTTDKADWIASVTARVGYAVLPDILLYGQGGPAWRHDKFNFTAQTALFAPLIPAGATLFTGPITSFGWTAGVGAEWMLLPHLSAFIEYDFFGFGARQDSFASPLGPGTTTFSAANQNINLVMLGLNYRFRLPGLTGE